MKSYISINKAEFEKLTKADQIAIVMRSKHVLTKTQALKEIKGYKNADKAQEPKKRKAKKDGL